MTGGYIFSLSTLAGGGYPISGLGRGGTPSQVGGVPSPRSGGYPVPGLGGYLVPGPGGYPVPGPGGYPIPGLGGTPGTPPRQSSTASTCYAAGGVPLAFTQEDFLVFCDKLNYQLLQENTRVEHNQKQQNINPVLLPLSLILDICTPQKEPLLIKNSFMFSETLIISWQLYSMSGVILFIFHDNS